MIQRTAIWILSVTGTVQSNERRDLTVFRRAWRAVCAVALVLTAAGCAARRPGSTTPSATLAPHAEITDPIGDARPVANFSTPPDLARATVTVAGGNITFTVRFAPNTFDRQDARVTIDLDTDLNPASVIPGDTGLGIDYVVHLWAQSGRTSIQKAVNAPPCLDSKPCYVGGGVGPLTLLDDGVQTTLPLSLFGASNGRMKFRVFAYLPQRVSGETTVVSDVMPDLGLPPASVQ